MRNNYFNCIIIIFWLIDCLFLSVLTGCIDIGNMKVGKIIDNSCLLDFFDF